MRPGGAIPIGVDGRVRPDQLLAAVEQRLGEHAQTYDQFVWSLTRQDVRA